MNGKNKRIKGVIKEDKRSVEREAIETTRKISEKKVNKGTRDGRRFRRGKSVPFPRPTATHALHQYPPMCVHVSSIVSGNLFKARSMSSGEQWRMYAS